MDNDKKPMTLDEAIEHCNNNAKKEIKCGNVNCMKEHIQLRDWLVELRNYRLRKNEIAND